MNIRSSKSNPRFVPGTDKPNKILRHQSDTKSYGRAQDNMSNTDKPACPSNLVSIVEQDRKTTELRGLFSSRTELQSLVVTEEIYLDNFALKGAMMRGIENALAEAI